MKWFYPIAIAVVAALTLWPLWALDKEKPDLYAGQVVRYDVYGAAVKSLDPATCGDTTSSSFQGNVYEGLYTYHFLKRPMKVIPDLAQEMPDISKDGLTYTIKIKKGVKFHRNPCFGKANEISEHPWATREVTADDFVLAFKRIADYHVNTGLAWAFCERIKGIRDYREKTRKYVVGDFSRYDLPVEGLEAVDDHTLRITLAKPFPQFLYVLAMHVTAPVAREAIDYHLGTEMDGKGGRRAIAPAKRGTEFREAEQVVGTGPYVWETFQRKKRIILVRNPDYRKATYPTEGYPGDVQAARKAKAKVLKETNDPNAAAAAYDKIINATSDKGQGLLEDAGKRVPFIDVLHYNYVAETYTAWKLFLTRQRDVSGISRDIFESVIQPGKKLSPRWKEKGIRLVTYWSPAIYWVAFNMEDPIVGQSKSLRQALCAAFDVETYLRVLFNDRGKRAVNILPSTFKGHIEAGVGPYYRYDLDLAKKKLKDARKELAAKGLLENGKIPQLVLDIGGTDSESIRRGQFFQQQFAKIGVDLKIQPNDWPKLQEKVSNKTTQLYTMGWHADYPDAENFLQLFYSPNIEKETNNTNYSNPTFDMLYELSRVMQDSPQRTKLYARMVNIVSEDVPVLLLTEPEGFVLVYEWVKNVKPHPIGYGYMQYRRIDAELRRKMGGKE